jgi:hypothetical protein
MKKKVYSTPGLTVFGGVEKITRYGSISNSDSPQGVSNTAFPAGS